MRTALPFFAAAAVLAAGLLDPGSKALAQSFGNSFNGLQVKGDQPIAIESDQLDVDDAQALATFTGNVNVAQGEMVMKTAKLLVFYVKDEAAKAGGGKTGGAKTGGAVAVEATPKASTGGALPGGSSEIDKMQASGKVYIKSADQVATSEKADFDMASQIAVLTGNVVMTQGDNVARGEILTIHMDTGLAKLGGGRVKILMAPQQKPAP